MNLTVLTILWTLGEASNDLFFKQNTGKKAWNTILLKLSLKGN